MENKNLKAALLNLLWVVCVSAVVSMALTIAEMRRHVQNYHTPPAAVQKSP